MNITGFCTEFVVLTLPVEGVICLLKRCFFSLSFIGYVVLPLLCSAQQSARESRLAGNSDVSRKGPSTLYSGTSNGCHFEFEKPGSKKRIWHFMANCHILSLHLVSQFGRKCIGYPRESTWVIYDVLTRGKRRQHPTTENGIIVFLNFLNS